MSDRLVQEVDPSVKAAPRAKPFSSYLGERNIVLLGDPGAGKTHLFRHFAAPSRPLRTRDFLNSDIETLKARSVLFIDGLDERRTGRGDETTVDAVVERLWQIKPDRVRISCRAPDWLGESDLAAFRPYFEQAGGITVLSLEGLTREEQVGVLTQHGVTSPQAFLEEAARRGLEELLTNPQNLIMLADVVRDKNWPSTRGELFKGAAEVLLTEHSPDHARRESGRYLPQELTEAAGAICAARLIADVDGICLANFSAAATLPTYRTIRLCDSDKVLAALGRRAFLSGSAPETVDYVHRTIAEYLAAQYLAQRVRSGLPLGRVRALIGIDGRPASELRGLHAWLAVLLSPEHAPVLIDADPYGVLRYGDAASLTKTNRAHLLHALGRLSKIDPGFREKDWTASSPIGALSGPDMTDEFRAILRDANAGYGFRSVVLDALSVGSPIPDLIADLVHILLSSDLPYSERDGALDALVHMAPHGPAEVARVYPKFNASADDLRMRANALQRLACTPAALAPTEIVSLLDEALSTDEKLIGGVLWPLGNAVQDRDLVAVLAAWSRVAAGPERNRKNVSEVLAVIDDLLIRCLAPEVAIDHQLLLTVLRCRSEISKYDGYGRVEGLRAALASNSVVLSAVAKLALPDLLQSGRTWAIPADLSKLLAGAADNALVLTHLMSVLAETKDEVIQQRAYEAAMGCCFNLGATASRTFEDLLAFADSIASLHEVRARCCYWTFPEWKTEESESRLNERIEREASISRTRQDFETHKHEIARGTHVGWLGWIARVYFSRFSDVDSRATPRERLVTQLGADNAQVAVEGLRALVLSGQVPPLNEVIQLHSQSRYFPWWLAVVAGLDEYVAAGNSVEGLSPSYLQSALAIDLLLPTYRQEGNVSMKADHPWKEKLIKERPHLVVEVYQAFARCDLERNVQAVTGLTELMRRDEFSAHRVNSALAFLQDFPTASPSVLAEMLPAAIGRCNVARVLQLVHNGLSRCLASGNEDSYIRWLATGLLVDLQGFRAKADELGSEEQRRLVWALRDSGVNRAQDGLPTGHISAASLEYAISLAAKSFERAEFPDGEDGWRGDTNAWDATRYILGMIGQLSVNLSEQATRVLHRLLEDPAISEFHDNLRHALASQRTLRIDATFRQPTWAQVLDALGDGPPANIADLHALALAHLRDLGPVIAASNTDIYKRFWNEDSRGRVSTPKVEESCRDALIDLLRGRLGSYSVTVEPEGHMSLDKRVDISISRPGMKVVIELKRDYHDEVWSAIDGQLERFYTRDPDAHGYGIYGVFWFGDKRPYPIPYPPSPHTRPQSVMKMLSVLGELVPQERRDRVVPFVIDVSGDVNRGTAS